MPLQALERVTLQVARVAHQVELFRDQSISLGVVILRRSGFSVQLDVTRSSQLGGEFFSAYFTLVRFLAIWRVHQLNVSLQGLPVGALFGA